MGEFKTGQDVVQFLVNLGVDQAHAAAAGEALFNQGIHSPDTFRGMTTQNMVDLGVGLVAALTIFGKQHKAAQAQSDSDSKAVKRLLEDVSRDNGSFVEESVRAKAADTFGSSTMQRFVARCLYDLVKLASPHGTPQDALQLAVKRVLGVVLAQFPAYVRALYDRARVKIQDPSGVLAGNPWVTDDGKIDYRNIGATFEHVKADGTLGQLVKKVLFANPTKDHEMDPLLRSDGPGLGVVMWLAAEKFVDELECDCRGKVDVLEPTRRAVVMGAEVKTSSSAIPDAKLQLVTRFKVISFLLAIMYNIDPNLIIFIGRVFYRKVPKGAHPAEAEDGSGHDLAVLSWYYHRI